MEQISKNHPEIQRGLVIQSKTIGVEGLFDAIHELQKLYKPATNKFILAPIKRGLDTFNRCSVVLSEHSLVKDCMAMFNSNLSHKEMVEKTIKIATRDLTGAPLESIEI